MAAVAPALFLISAILSIVSADLNPGFGSALYGFNSHNPKRYALGIYIKAKWRIAFDYCYDHGMNLASITSRDEQEQIAQLIKKTYGYNKETYWWTGGSDAGHEGQFKWKGSEKPVTYSNWRSGEPNNMGNNQHCLELWNEPHHEYGWNDRNCDDQYFFICEHFNSSYPYEYV